MRGHAWMLTVFAGLVCHQCFLISPAHSFFFGPFFRRQASSSSSLSSNRDHVVNSGDVAEHQNQQQATTGLRISNRPPPPPSSPSGSARLNPSGSSGPSFVYAPVGNQDFHVPKSLCIACEKFPWMPVAGSEQQQQPPPPQSAPAPSGPPPPPQPYQVQHQVIDVPPDQPTATVVVKAAQTLGDNRRPFAIQFDSSQTQNTVAQQANDGPPVYDAPKPQPEQQQPTVLQPVPAGHAFHPTSRPAQFYRRPASPDSQSQPATGPSTLQPVPPINVPYTRPFHQQPTVLQPVKNNGVPSPSSSSESVQSTGSSANPIALSVPLPPTAPTKNYQVGSLGPGGYPVVFANSGPSISPPIPGQSYGAPFSPLTAGTLVVAQQHQQRQQQQQKFQQILHQQQQQDLALAHAQNSGFRIHGLRPPAPNQQQQEHAHNSGFRIQDVQPAQLIYQEHTKVNGGPLPSQFQPQPQPSQQYGVRPEGFQVPIISQQQKQPFGTLKINQIPVDSVPNRFQTQFRPRPSPPQQGYGGPPPPPPTQQQGYGGPPPPPSQFNGNGPQISQSYGPPPQNLPPPPPPQQTYGPPQYSPPPPLQSYVPSPPPQQSYGPPPPQQLQFRPQGNGNGIISQSYGGPPPPPLPPPPQNGGQRPFFSRIPQLSNGGRPSFSYGPPPPPNNNYGPALFIVPQQQRPQINVPPQQTLSLEMEAPPPPQNVIQNQNFNLPPPPPPQQYGPPPPSNNNNNNGGQIFFPRPQQPPQLLQLSAQYGPAQLNNQQQGQQGGEVTGGSGGDGSQSPSGITIPYLLDIEPDNNRLPENVQEGFSSSHQINIQSLLRGQKEPRIVPIPVPKYFGSESQSELSQTDFVPSPMKTTFSPQLVGKDVDESLGASAVKNPFLQQSVENFRQGEKDRGQRLEGKGRPLKGGWEIIPATQYDITHLFDNAPPGQRASITVDSRRPVPDPLPIPVPFPLPLSSKPTKSPPVFVVSEQAHSQFSVTAEGQQLEPSETVQNNEQQQAVEPTVDSTLTTVQGEDGQESIQNVGNVDDDSNKKSEQTQTSSSSQSSPLSIVTPIQSLPVSMNGRPFSVGIPIVQSQVKPTHFDPLPPSIVTALHHAQRTSFLTHSHLVSQPLDGGRIRQQPQQQPQTAQTVYVNSVPVRPDDIESQAIDSETGDAAEGGRDSNRIESAKSIGLPSQQIYQQQGIPFSPCRHHQDQLALPYGHQQNVQQQFQGRDRPPYLFYYPTSVQQSSVYWAERPQAQPSQEQQQQRYPPFHSTLVAYPTTQTFAQSGGSKEPSGAETVFSPPVFGWSPKIVQTFNALAPEPSSTFLSEKEQQGDVTTTTRQPFDIISLGAENIVDEDDKVQSLETIDTPTTTTTTTTTTVKVPTSSSTTSKTGFVVIRPQPVRPSTIPVSSSVVVPAVAESFRHSEYQAPTTTTTLGTSKYVESTSSDFKPLKTYVRPKSPKLVEDSSSKFYTEIFGPTTTADCITDPTTTEQSIFSTDNNNGIDSSTPYTTNVVTTTTTAVPIVYSSPRIKSGGPEKIRLRVGARFPAGRPPISTSAAEPTSATSSGLSPTVSATAVPVYRPTSYNQQRGESSETSSSESQATPINVLTFGDIYKNSETRQGESTQQLATSTEQSSSFSVSMDSSSSMSTSSSSSSSSSSFGDRERTSPRKLYSSGGGGGDEVTALGSDHLTQSVSGTTTPIPSSLPSDVENNGLSSPSPSMATSTKIVKTVRVRQRMRPGQGGGPMTRSRFTHGHGGRVRVVQRPVTPEYIKNFPEFAAPEGEALGKEEQEEVKNALIDLKKI